jgi:hypothetical protein
MNGLRFARHENPVVRRLANSGTIIAKKDIAKKIGNNNAIAPGGENHGTV